MTKPKHQLKPDGILYVYSCRFCHSVHLVDLTYFEHDLRFYDNRKTLRTPQIECPLCGSTMEQVNNFPKSGIEEKLLENAKRMVGIAARMARNGFDRSGSP